MTKKNGGSTSHTATGLKIVVFTQHETPPFWPYLLHNTMHRIDSSIPHRSHPGLENE